MRKLTAPTVYLAAPALATAALSAAIAALLAAGYIVTTAAHVEPSADVDGLLAAVGADTDAIAAADALVTVGDCSKLFEPVMAEIYNVPVVTLADALAGAR
ncbi:hypothetical protein [Micromonospora sp. NPDC003241]